MLENADRGQSAVVGYAILLGLVVGGALLVVVFGGAAIDDLQAASDLEGDQYTMREVDSRLSQIAVSRSDVQTLEFGDGEVAVSNESYMNVTVNQNAVCRLNIPMGSLSRESDRGRVAYEGGGVWVEERSGARMLSPPDFQYRNGTIDFPLTQIGGTVERASGRLTASYNETASLQTRQQIRKTLGRSECRQPTNVTIVVQSDYYRAWGQFLEQKTGVTPSYFASNETTRVFLSKIGGSVNPTLAGKSVTASSDYVATLKILGIEASVTDSGSNWEPSGVSFSGGDAANINDPMEFAVLVDGTKKTPFGDGDPNDANTLFDDDLNSPTYEDDMPITATITGNSSTSFEVQTKMTECGHGDRSHWTYTGVVTNGFNTPSNTYYEYRCNWAGISQPGDVRVTVNSASSSSNFILLEDGDKVPGSEAVNDAQSPLQEILGSRIDANKRLQLDSNQAVYVYDISGTSGDADCDNDGVPGYDANDDGVVDDPDDDTGTNCDDFNDAVVLVELNQPGTVGAEADFVISISAKRVQINEN
jgi:hypothetical protein